MRTRLIFLLLLAAGFMPLGCDGQPDQKASWRHLSDGKVFRESGLVQQSLTHLFRALREGEVQNDAHLIASACLELGDLYEQYYRYNESIPYLKKAFRLLLHSDSIEAQAKCANSIAWNYIKINNMDSALHYAQQSVARYEALPSRSAMNYCIALESAGEIYSHRKEFQEASNILEQCMDLAITHQLPVAIGFTHYGLALNSLNQKQLIDAERHIEACVPVARQYASKELLADVYQLAYRIYDQLHLPSEAYPYLADYARLQDELHSEDIERKAAIINADYEIQRKEDEVKILQQTNSIQQLEITNQQLMRNLAIGGLALVVTLAGVIYWRIRSSRERERQELKRQSDELEQARKMQVSLLPRQALNNTSFVVHGKMKTATEVGGDYYDYFELDDHRVLIVFGDATGHGMSAGLLVTIAKVALLNKIHVLQGNDDLRPLAQAVNDSILSAVAVKGMGMAMQFFLLDRHRQTLTFSSNGMPYPLVLSRAAKTICALEMRHPPLGFLRQLRTSQQTLFWSSDQVLLLASDGITERFNSVREEFGEGRVQATVLKHATSSQTLEGMLQHLFDAADQFAEGCPQEDDMTALVASFH